MSKRKNNLTRIYSNSSEERMATVLEGMQEAIGSEVGRLFSEGHPVWIWKDGKVVDVMKEMKQRGSAEFSGENK